MAVDISDDATNDSSNSTFQCSICLENLAAPASIDWSGSSQQGTPVASMPGSNRGRKRQPVVKSNDNNCLTDVVATKCGHLYHTVCLLEWFQKNDGARQCPTCRHDIPTKDGIRQVYPGGYQPKSDPSSDSSKDENDGVDEEEAYIKDVMHKTLVKDHEELLEEAHQMRQNEGVKDAQIASLTEDNTKKATEIRELKRTIAELVGSDSGDYGPSPNKRRPY